jgi:hypothetical protein
LAVNTNFHGIFTTYFLAIYPVDQEEAVLLRRKWMSNKIGWNWNVWRINDETWYKDGLAEDLMEIVYNL